METVLSGYSRSLPGTAGLASWAGPPWAGSHRSGLRRLGRDTRDPSQTEHRTQAGTSIRSVTPQPDGGHGPDTPEKPGPTSTSSPSPSGLGFCGRKGEGWGLCPTVNTSTGWPGKTGRAEVTRNKASLVSRSSYRSFPSSRTSTLVNVCTRPRSRCSGPK